MLTQLLTKLIRRDKRYATEVEVRELISSGQFEAALVASTELHPATPKRELLRICLQAEIAFRRHKDTEAESLYERVLKQAPGFTEAHYGLSLLKHAGGEYESAFHHALFAQRIAPTNPRYLSQLGLCHVSLGNFSLAEEILRRTLRQSPNDRAAWNNLGIAMLAKNHAIEAKSCFVNALKLDPTFALAQQNLDQLKADTGDRSDADQTGDDTPLHHLLHVGETPNTLKPSPDSLPAPWHEGWEQIRAKVASGTAAQAFADAESLLQNHPDADELAVLVDRLYRSLGEPDSGQAVLHAFLIRHPDSVHAHLGLGESLLRQSDYGTAELHLRKALELGPRVEPVLQALGRTMLQRKRYAEALEIYTECHQRWPSDITLANLAISQYHACDYPGALVSFEQLQQRHLVAHLDLQSVHAQTLAFAGRIDEALALIKLDSEKHGNPPHLRMIRAAMHLLVEDYGPGWDGYRHRQLGLNSFRVLPVPEWQGDHLEGKTIVVLAEQGLGDQIMFASCLSDLLALKPTRVVVEAIHRVAPTLTRSFPDCEFIASRQDKKMEWLRDIEGVDCFVPLAELPRYFRRSLESFPRRAYLHPSTERVRFWRSRLESLGPGPYLGTSWRGGTEITRTVARSLSPALLHPLVSALPSQWVSLQYGEVQDELATASAAGVRLTHWPEAIADLDEFAALTAALDGVFTVCNTTVHYAGAVGQRVWVLAPHVPEWRYGLYNSHMPWYPTVEVLRQPALNAWPEVINVARARLIDNYRQAIGHPI